MVDKHPVKQYPIVGACGLNCGLCPRYILREHQGVPVVVVQVSGSYIPEVVDSLPVV